MSGGYIFHNGVGLRRRALTIESLNDATLTRLPYGMVIVSSFELGYNELSGVFKITTNENICCPLCNGELTYRDSIHRMVKDLLGEIRHFCLRRLRCQTEVCKKLHTELPSIIQPYKHFDSDAIQSVLDGNGDTSACVADNSTIRRWKSEFALAQPDINQRLTSVYAQMSDEKVPISATIHILDKIKIEVKRWLAFVMVLLINSGHKLCTRFAFCPSGFSGTVSLGNKNDAEGGKKKDDQTIENSS